MLHRLGVGVERLADLVALALDDALRARDLAADQLALDGRVLPLGQALVRR